MIERFLNTYKDGFEVYLNPSEKDQIIEEIERLNKMLEEKFMKENPFLVENGIICKKNKEIERLNENNQAMQEEMARTWKKNDELHSIIKEVREWILFQQENSMEPYIATDTLDEILEILDKENEK